MQSDTTTKGQAASASRTLFASGRLTAGLVAITHSALILPSPTLRKRSTAFSPGFVAMDGAAQKRPTVATFSGAKSLCAASVEARPPTPRPPIALGWPEIDRPAGVEGRGG